MVRVLLTALLIAACPWTPAAVATAQTITLPGGIPDIFTTRVDIEAPPAQVWAVLTDFPAYPIWNPFIYPVKGAPHLGSMLEMTIHHGTRSIPYQAIVAVVRPNRELAIRIPSVEIVEVTFDFTIETVRAGRTRLTAREKHTGVAGVVAGGLLRDIESGLDAMAKAARDRAELLQLVPFGVPILRYTSWAIPAVSRSVARRSPKEERSDGKTEVRGVASHLCLGRRRP
ncbi:MAG TPA: SRPBCC domain-containing protein [bacterium]|nr:SRPBCC domain-containing protein [bacterium]